MTIDKEAVGKRLSEFAERFRSQSELARALGMKKHQQLYPYLKGQSLPGFEIIAKLRELGCDPNWLIAGEGNAPQGPKWEEGNLEYDTDKIRAEVEGQIDKVVKMSQIAFGAMKPSEARELRQALKIWAIKNRRRSDKTKARQAKK